MKRIVRTGVLLLVCFSLLLGGGCTAALWDSVDPKERIWMPASRVTEEQLQAEGRTYTKTRLMHAEPVEGYLVEKTDLEKLRDGVVLVAATPFTVVGDGVLVVFCVVLCNPELWSCAADALINH